MNPLHEQILSLERPAAVMAVALPAAGKTTIAAELQAAIEAHAPGVDVATICADTIRDELADAGERQAIYNPAQNEMVHGIAHERTEAVLRRGGIAIIDASHLSRDPYSTRREQTITRYRNFGAATVAALVLHVPLDVAYARNEARGRAGKGYVRPADMAKMDIYRQIHPISAAAPGAFDVAFDVY